MNIRISWIFISLVISMSLPSCSPEPVTEGRPKANVGDSDWWLYNPPIFATNIPNDHGIFLKFVSENIAKSTGQYLPDVTNNVLDKTTLKNISTNKNYNLSAALSNDSQQTFVELKAAPMDDGVHVLSLDSYNKQETLNYPFSVGSSDAPLLFKVSHSTSRDPAPNVITLSFLFSEPVLMQQNHFSIEELGASSVDIRPKLSGGKPRYVHEFDISYPPNTTLEGKTFTVKLDLPNIRSKISGKPLALITDSAFDLSELDVYEGVLTRQGDTITLSWELGDTSGILWGVHQPQIMYNMSREGNDPPYEDAPRP